MCAEKKCRRKQKLLFILVEDTHKFLLINWHKVVFPKHYFIMYNCHYQWSNKLLLYLTVSGSAEHCSTVCGGWVVTQRPCHLGYWNLCSSSKENVFSAELRMTNFHGPSFISISNVGTENDFKSTDKKIKCQLNL